MLPPPKLCVFSGSGKTFFRDAFVGLPWTFPDTMRHLQPLLFHQQLLIPTHAANIPVWTLKLRRRSQISFEISIRGPETKWFDTLFRAFVAFQTTLCTKGHIFYNGSPLIASRTSQPASMLVRANDHSYAVIIPDHLSYTFFFFFSHLHEPSGSPFFSSVFYWSRFRRGSVSAHTQRHTESSATCRQ